MTDIDVKAVKDALNEPSAIEKLTSLRSQVEDARTQMREAAKQVVQEGTKAIFAEYGDLVERFGWTQYTPYFNDGEPCEFGVHELAVVGWEDIPEDRRADADEREEYLDSETDWPYESFGVFSAYGDNSKVSYSSRWSGENRKGEERYDDALGAIQQVYEALSSDDLAKDVFGDHVQVIFTKDGVDVEEYSHE